MPTGYTSIIDNGGSFDQYVWRCATAFFRSSDGYDLPEKLTVTPYYAERVEKLSAELEALKSTDHNEAYKTWFAQRTTDYVDSIVRNNAELAAYNTMRGKVRDWTPPTPEHAALKAFMSAQLSDGAPYDLSASEFFHKPKEQDPLSWFYETLSEKSIELARAHSELREQEGHCVKANAWLEELRGSVPFVRQP